MNNPEDVVFIVDSDGTQAAGGKAVALQDSCWRAVHISPSGQSSVPLRQRIL
ncbi:hypothetical protein [Corynebacterium provencense]|uniref:hypothetical protein n=1 Tax=Corynebacterium provencense TaxID=1737425 RepID=UPI001D131A9D|nr:hypothetical protein [Corynebacterium provencense]